MEPLQWDTNQWTLLLHTHSMIRTYSGTPPIGHQSMDFASTHTVRYVRTVEPLQWDTNQWTLLLHTQYDTYVQWNPSNGTLINGLCFYTHSMIRTYSGTPPMGHQSMDFASTHTQYDTYVQWNPSNGTPINGLCFYTHSMICTYSGTPPMGHQSMDFASTHTV